MLLGIIALATWTGPILGVPAIVLAVRARGRIGAAHGQLGGDSMALAGLVTGILATAIFVLALVFLMIDRATGNGFH